MVSAARAPQERLISVDPFSLAFWFLAALTLVRVIGVIVSPVELHGDEAQYWMWSQSLDWGYYSKPPLIAWSVALTTGLFGDGEWAVRLAAPFAHGGAAAFLGLGGRALYGARAGAAAMMLYATMPAVWLSSGIVSTDAFLLLFWSAGLYALIRLIQTPHWRWAVALGVSIGLGVLSKYAMTYFIAGVVLLSLLSPRARRALVSPPGVLAAFIALIIVAPNLLWNAANDFSTLAHTADNANWTGPRFRLHKLGEFWQEQFAVFGPFTLLMLFAALAFPFRPPAAALLQTPPQALMERRWNVLFLAAFILPALLIISAQAFINRANANWAAAAYAGGALLLAGWIFGPAGLMAGARAWGRRLASGLFAFAVAVNIIGGGMFASAAMSATMADRVLCTPQSWPGDVACAGAGFKRARGWRETAAAVRTRFNAGAPDGGAYAAVAADNRLLFHDLDYYLRDDKPPLRMWLKSSAPKSFAEEQAPLTPADTDRGPVLVVSQRERDQDSIAADFATFVLIDIVDIDLGPAGTRRLWFYAGEGFAPAPR